jgi:hypothetical protein
MDGVFNHGCDVLGFLLTGARGRDFLTFLLAPSRAVFFIGCMPSGINFLTYSSFCRVEQASNADKHCCFKRFKRFSAKSTIKIAQ